MTKITSLQNPHIRKILMLRDRKGREQFDEFAIEGLREINKALKNHHSISALYYCPALLNTEARVLVDFLMEKKVKSFEITETGYNKIAVRKEHDGIILVCTVSHARLSALKLPQNPLLLLIEGIEKPGNLGALIRSADGAGVDAIMLVDSKVDLYNPNVIRASLGCCFSLPIYTVSSLEAHKYCMEKQISIYAAILDTKSQEYSSLNYQNASAILLGSEDQGLTNFWHSRADAKIYIPMHGTADSLNVSVAGAIIMYEARRQR